MKCLEQLVRKHICCSPTSWTLFNLPTEGAEPWTTQSPWQHTHPSSPLTENTVCDFFSVLLCSFFTSKNISIKFAGNRTVVGLIADNDETADRAKQANNLSLTSAEQWR